MIIKSHGSIDKNTIIQDKMMAMMEILIHSYPTTSIETCNLSLMTSLMMVSTIVEVMIDMMIEGDEQGNKYSV